MIFSPRVALPATVFCAVVSISLFVAAHHIYETDVVHAFEEEDYTERQCSFKKAYSDLPPLHGAMFYLPHWEDDQTHMLVTLNPMSLTRNRTLAKQQTGGFALNKKVPCLCHAIPVVFPVPELDMGRRIWKACFLDLQWFDNYKATRIWGHLTALGLLLFGVLFGSMAILLVFVVARGLRTQRREHDKIK